MSTLTLASTSRRLSSGRCFCSSSRLLASEPTLSGIPDLSATPNAVESTSGHSGSAAAPSEVPATAEGPAAAGRPGRKGASLNDWLAGEGSKYRRPMNKSTNWLSRTPFPLNPSFAPPPPLSDLMRNHIYKQVKDALTKKTGASPQPESAVLRSVAQQHNISAQRVAAIVKLKVAQEQHVKSGLALQKDFSQGMESALGVSAVKDPRRIAEPVEGIKAVLTHQMRQVFEMPDEEAGEQAVLPSMLDAANASKKSPSSTSAHTPKQAATADQTWHVPSRRKEASPTIVVQNVANTPLGRQWERSNKNDSASEAVKQERAEQRKIKKRENEVAWEAYT